MKTIVSIVTALALLSLLLFFTTTTSAASVRIGSISPDKAHSGKKETITVRITNDSDSAQGVKLVGSVPNGCSLKTLQSEAGSSGTCKVTVPAKKFFDATFELSFSDPNSSGDITWTVKTSWGSKLDTKKQAIVCKRNMDEVRKEIEASLNTSLKTGNGFKELVETGMGDPKYVCGALAEPVAIYPKDASVWADGYNNITYIGGNVSLDWRSNMSSKGNSRFIILITVEGANGGALKLTWKHKHAHPYHSRWNFDLPGITNEDLEKALNAWWSIATAAGS